MLEENHDLKKIIEDAKEYRWYSIPDMYMVEILDTTGRSAGFVLSADTDGASSVDRLIKTLRSTWKYVEKVNAHLVVED